MSDAVKAALIAGSFALLGVWLKDAGDHGRWPFTPPKPIATEAADVSTLASLTSSDVADAYSGAITDAAEPATEDNSPSAQSHSEDMMEDDRGNQQEQPVKQSSHDYTPPPPAGITVANGCDYAIMVKLSYNFQGSWVAEPDGKFWQIDAGETSAPLRIYGNKITPTDGQVLIRAEKLRDDGVFSEGKEKYTLKVVDGNYQIQYCSRP